MLCREDAPLVKWVSTDAELAKVAVSWGDCITLDTEFVRTNTYYPMPGLYQVGAGAAVFLLDPLTITDWQPFQDVLASSDVVKVMHACQEDSELIHQHLGVTLVNVFDTQFAHAFVSNEFSLSYANLVALRIGVSLDKHETRSNWLARPLTDRQIDYAVEDVIYLQEMYLDISCELVEQGKLDWFLPDMRERASYRVSEPQAYYRNVKKAWNLPPLALGRLQQLCAWRELTAQRENVPRNRVVWDDHLYQFAASGLVSKQDVHDALPPSIAQRYTTAILETLDVPPDLTLDPIPRPLTSRQDAVVKVLRDRGLITAKEQRLAPELICRKRDLEACVRHYAENEELPARYDSWRGGVVGKLFLSILQGGDS